MFADDEGREDGAYSKHEVEEEDGGLAKTVVAILFVYFGDDVLEWVVGGEHDHEGDSEQSHSLLLLGMS